MRLAVAAALLVLVGLAGCGGSGGSHPRSLPPGSVVLPTLPAQGLIDERRRGIALLDLRGRRLAWLPGFAVYPRGGIPSHPSEAWAFLVARVRPPLLHGPRGWYRLDVARHALLPVRGGRLPLAGGATVVARGGQPFAATFTVKQGGRTILLGSNPTFRLLSRRLVQAGTELLDVRTGRRWKLPPGCLPARNTGTRLILACGVVHGSEAVARLVLGRLAPTGSFRRLTSPLAQLGPEAAWLSPDGRWVAVEGDTGCAASYVYLEPVSGGAARHYLRPLSHRSVFVQLFEPSRVERRRSARRPPHARSLRHAALRPPAPRCVPRRSSHSGAHVHHGLRRRDVEPCSRALTESAGAENIARFAQCLVPPT